MSTLNMGDKLTHKESGDEAEYFVSVPTVAHGFMHVLKSAKGYILRLTGDLEAEFSKQGETQTLAESGSPLSTVDQSVMDKLNGLEALLKSLGVTTDNPTGSVGTPAGTAPATPATPAVPDAAAHLAPTDPVVTPPLPLTAPTEGTEDPAAAATASEPEVSAETVEPPSNSIPF